MADAKLLAAIERSDTEQLQISISEYRGKSYLNMRIFYTTDDGQTWLPTKKGVTFTPEQIDMLEEAIQEAKKELHFALNIFLDFSCYIGLFTTRQSLFNNSRVNPCKPVYLSNKHNNKNMLLPLLILRGWG